MIENFPKLFLANIRNINFFMALCEHFMHIAKHFLIFNDQSKIEFSGIHVYTIRWRRFRCLRNSTSISVHQTSIISIKSHKTKPQVHDYHCTIEISVVDNNFSKLHNHEINFPIAFWKLISEWRTPLGRRAGGRKILNINQRCEGRGKFSSDIEFHFL